MYIYICKPTIHNTKCYYRLTHDVVLLVYFALHTWCGAVSMKCGMESMWTVRCKDTLNSFSHFPFGLMDWRMVIRGAVERKLIKLY